MFHPLLSSAYEAGIREFCRAWDVDKRRTAQDRPPPFKVQTDNRVVSVEQGS
jgi:hypothetical protein